MGRPGDEAVGNEPVDDAQREARTGEAFEKGLIGKPLSRKRETREGLDRLIGTKAQSGPETSSSLEVRDSALTMPSEGVAGLERHEDQEASQESHGEAGDLGEDEAQPDPRRKRFGNVARLGSKLVRSSAIIKSLAGRSKGVFSGLSQSAPKQTTTVTIEHGYIKLLVTLGDEVVDYSIVPANYRLFREGLVSDTSRVASLLRKALQELNIEPESLIGAVPGYQTNLRRIELPNVKEMDPKIVIPNEARRLMAISTENSHLAWHQVPGTADTNGWLVVSATNRSISSLSATAEAAGVSIETLELRPFAVARATNQADAVFAWTAADGCDGVVVRDWVPITYQSAYWGTGSAAESTDQIINRITEVLGSTINAHDAEHPEMAVSEDIPLFIYGALASGNDDIARRVAYNLGRQAARPEIPLKLPDDFPVDDFVVNIGLSVGAI